MAGEFIALVVAWMGAFGDFVVFSTCRLVAFIALPIFVVFPAGFKSFQLSTLNAAAFVGDARMVKLLVYAGVAKNVQNQVCVRRAGDRGRTHGVFFLAGGWITADACQCAEQG